ncbi:hypothetical protein MMC16_005085 [Acarospora aff. strigata]|nr:hypothetical protein [Acarospora aff. strigata]
MSALYKTFSAFRLARVAPRAAFSTSIRTQKSAIDAAKDTLKEIDRKVADSAVKGIEKGEQASQAVKEAAGISTAKADATAQQATGEAKGTMKEMAGKAKGTMQELKGEAKGKASELAGEAKGTTADEMAGKAKGTAKEMAGEAKGKASELMGEAKGKKEEVKSKM